MKLLLLILFILSIVSSHHFKARPILIMQATNKINDILNDDPYYDRMLQTDTLHHLKINGAFPSSSTLINLQYLKKQFSVATLFLSRMIKCRKLANNRVKISDPQNDGQKCINAIPSVYIDQGINLKEIDVQFFITLQEQQNNLLGTIKNCGFFRNRIIFGQIFFNTRFFKLQTNDYFQWTITSHLYILNTILGATLFKYYFTDTFRTQQLPFDKIFKQENGRYYIITPNVLKYVQDYFDCNDGTTGAILSTNFNIKDPYGAAFDQSVYADEISSQSLTLQEDKVTPLTINLLKDSNMWDQVDAYTFTQKSVHGKGKGCKFAQDIDHPYPEYCNNQQFKDATCNIYHSYYGYCPQNQIVMTAYANAICRYPWVVKQNKFSIRKYQQQGFNSGCFNVQNSASYCLSSKCISNKQTIIFTVDQTSYSCSKEKQMIYVKQLKRNVECPNIQIFCNNQQCQNWCQKDGICINGICMGIICPIQNCVFCAKDQTGYICQECKQGLFLYNKNSCKSNCPSGYYQIGANCMPCSAICNECQQNQNRCTSCKENYYWEKFTCKQCNREKCQIANITVSTSQANQQDNDGKISIGVFVGVLLGIFIPALIFISLLIIIIIYMKCSNSAQIQPRNQNIGNSASKLTSGLESQTDLNKQGKI